MKKLKKFLGGFCAFCMVMTMVVPAFAASESEVTSSTLTGNIVRSSTPSYRLVIDTNNQTQTANWPITSTYGYYKIWFKNTSASTIRVALYEGNTSGDPINYMDVLSGQSSSLRNADINTPLDTDTYYIVLTVIGGSNDLSGMCYYKNGTTFADVI